MKPLHILLGILIALAAGYGIGRYAQPAKIEIKKEEVIKEVEVIKKDVVIVEKEVKNPDGTVTTERVITDKTQIDSKKETTEKQSSIVSNKKADWKVSASVGAESLKFTQPVYGLHVERRILGPFFIGAYGMTNSNYGVSIGMEF